MPSNTLSSIYGWTIYLFASGAFLALASFPVRLETDASAARQVMAVLDGISATLNSLRPGITLTVTYQSSQPNLRLWIYQNTLSAMDGSLVLARNLSWAGPLVEIVPGTTYEAAVVAGSLSIVAKGLG